MLVNKLEFVKIAVQKALTPFYLEEKGKSLENYQINSPGLHKFLSDYDAGDVLSKKTIQLKDILLNRTVEP